MKVLIIDNERPMRETTKAMLEAFCPEVETIEMGSDIAGGLDLIRRFQPDLLLLDVELDEGTGFDLLRQLPAEPSFQLVFITAYDKYAITAFQFSAIDFLLKPIDPDALSACVQKAAKSLKTQQLSGQIEYLLSRMASPQEAVKRIVLKDAEHIFYVRPSDICYCEADGVYTRFFLDNGKTITVSKNLKEYEQILEPLGFLRTHNSYLANPDKIIRFEKNTDTLILEGNVAVPLSHRKKDLVLRMLDQR
jgi:two-component system LytT family response regulator